MASKIRVLSDHTINQIAAGEVIENPASVVKELVENSLDAGATDIGIEIHGGGRQMIRISDNGCGMNSDDALLCLERHATSKLRGVEEIHSLGTMGFRGEAIPSIASISKFNLITCPAPESGPEQPTGTMVIVDGGKIVSCHPAARSQGTTIEVKSLFFNVPVRKKFLKSPSIDASEILKTMSLIALGHPHIKFQLISDGKTVLSAPASQETSFGKQLQERIQNILGTDFCRNTLPIEEKGEGISVRGVVGLPSYTRHNRTGQYLFINQRAIVSPLIAYAVKEGFSTAMPEGRFSVFVLHLMVPGSLVDVNVHPQKREVRLRQEQQIKELIIRAVRNGLRCSPPFENAASKSDTRFAASPAFAQAFLQPESVHRFEEVPSTWTLKKKLQEAPPLLFSLPDLPQNEQEHRVKEPFKEPPSSAEYCQVPDPVIHTRSQPGEHAPELPLALPSSPACPPLKVLASIPGYILLDASSPHPLIEKACRRPEKGGIVLIDQKNAQARIVFETLSSHCSNGIAEQTLLIPLPVELPSFESDLLRKAIPSLGAIGFRIREFGTNTFLVDSVPQFFSNSNLELLISDMIHELSSWQPAGEAGPAAIQASARRMAQAAARAAGCLQRRLSLFEAQGMLDRLICCGQPLFCPFGRPVVAQISADELAKLF